MKLSRRAAVASAMASAAAVAAPASAQDFQQGKPITIVAPFGPGTTNDIIARLLAQDMTATLGQASSSRTAWRHRAISAPTMSRSRDPTATRWSSPR